MQLIACEGPCNRSYPDLQPINGKNLCYYCNILDLEKKSDSKEMLRSKIRRNVSIEDLSRIESELHFGGFNISNPKYDIGDIFQYDGKAYKIISVSPTRSVVGTRGVYFYFLQVFDIASGVWTFESNHEFFLDRCNRVYFHSVYSFDVNSFVTPRGAIVDLLMIFNSFGETWSVTIKSNTDPDNSLIVEAVSLLDLINSIASRLFIEGQEYYDNYRALEKEIRLAAGFLAVIHVSEVPTEKNITTISSNID